MVTTAQPFANVPPRHLPHRPLPAYRYTPGHTPHPVTSPEGHSAGQPAPTCVPLTCANWPEHEAWLYGVDLYNASYWWEAHEQWEAAWRLADVGSDTAHLLQGLIQLAAALLKWNVSNARGRAGLWRRGRDHLTSVSANPWLGVQVPMVVRAADDFFRRYPQALVPEARQEGRPAGWPTGPVLQLVSATDATR